MLRVAKGSTCEGEERAAARELAAQLDLPDAALALVFVSPRYDQERMAAALAEHLPMPVYGCTALVEIDRGSFARDRAVALALGGRGVRAGVALAERVSEAPLARGSEAVASAAAQLELSPGQLDARRHIGVTLIDWRAQCEERFMAAVAASANRISFVGGSSSDEVDAECSRVIARGRAYARAALVILFELDVPFRAVVLEHMHPLAGRVVVTETDPANRIVHELNGRPAVDVYRELLGGHEVDMAIAGQRPFGYYIDGEVYVRSVMSIEGSSLRFACGVDRGTVLVPMAAGDMISATREGLAHVDAELRGMQAMLVFDCFGRYLEASALDMLDDVSAVYRNYPMIGFSTYGEQVNSMHVNHTMTGLALGGGHGGNGQAGGRGG